MPQQRGLDGNGGVHVNVNQQTAIIQSGRPRSFEEAGDFVCRRHAQEQQQSLDPLSVHSPFLAEKLWVVP